MAGLLEVYVDLARIQAVLLPYLESPSASSRDNLAFDDIGDELLSKMNHIHSKIDHVSAAKSAISSLPARSNQSGKIASPSALWKGLDMQSEIAALEFAFHSVMTAIFHLRQVTSSQTATSTELYLQSARQPLSALVSMCLSCDKQSTVAFLHWCATFRSALESNMADMMDFRTLLYYPLTAYLALFCNVVTTANFADFQLLSTIADCLVHSGSISAPIAQLQSLFRRLVSLAQCFLPGHRRSITHDASFSTAATMPPQVSSEDARGWPSWAYWGEAGAAFSTTMMAADKDDNAALLDLPTWDPFLVLSEDNTFVGNDLGN